jgi:hypothetical protein
VKRLSVQAVCGSLKSPSCTTNDSGKLFMCCTTLSKIAPWFWA